MRGQGNWARWLARRPFQQLAYRFVIEGHHDTTRHDCSIVIALLAVSLSASCVVAQAKQQVSRQDTGPVRDVVGILRGVISGKNVHSILKPRVQSADRWVL